MKMRPRVPLQPRTWLWLAVALAPIVSACSNSSTDPEPDSAVTTAPVNADPEPSPAAGAELPVSTSTPVDGSNDPRLADIRLAGFAEPPVIGNSILIDRFDIGGPTSVDASGEPTLDADGSGCSPPDDSLPDGAWLVRLEGIESTEGGVGIAAELLCRYSGQNAVDRFPDEAVQDQRIVHDPSKQVAADVSINAVIFPGYCWVVPTAPTPFAPGFGAIDLLTAMAGDSDPFQGSFDSGLPLWLLVEDGLVVEILDGFYSCAG
ncbi:MAG: hypothetical protein ACI8Y4_000570 [Candidatus Poriferisodalaceae bacterium]|jgi:hypothetical protein